MHSLFGTLLFASSILWIPTAQAEGPMLPLVTITFAPTTTAAVSTPTALDLIDQYAARYEVSADDLEATIRCESNFDSQAIGDNGSSFGIAQIHLPAHPEITKQEALDPRWSIDWMAKMFAAGHADSWTCYTNRQR